MKNLMHINGERQALIDSLEECLRLVESGELDSVCWVACGKELVMRGAGGKGSMSTILGELRKLEFSLLNSDFEAELTYDDSIIH